MVNCVFNIKYNSRTLKKKVLYNAFIYCHFPLNIFFFSLSFFFFFTLFPTLEFMQNNEVRYLEMLKKIYIFIQFRPHHMAKSKL